MIREKLLNVFYWIKDHVLILLEVVVRLSIGLQTKQNNPTNESSQNEETEDSDKEG